MVNLGEYFSALLESEKELYCYLIDLLSKEYGWTIEYIQNLTVPEITRLVKTIRRRKDLEDQLNQINIAKGFAGKISSNHKAPKKGLTTQESDTRNLELLSKMFKKKPDKDGKVVI